MAFAFLGHVKTKRVPVYTIDRPYTLMVYIFNGYGFSWYISKNISTQTIEKNDFPYKNWHRHFPHFPV